MKQINPKIFRAYDIRGIVPQDLDIFTAELIGKGFGTFLSQKKSKIKVVVGRDNRVSSFKLQKAFIKGLISTGTEVIDIGMVITPLVYFGTYFLKTEGGAMITASHCPPEYNGFKLTKSKANPVFGKELTSIYKIIKERKFKKGKGSLIKKDISLNYLEEIAKRISLKKSLKIIIDTGNGTAGLFAPKLFKKLGCEVKTIYQKPIGTFPHHIPDPEIEENVFDLKLKIIKTKEKDIGIGIDGDGDRLGVIDEKGRHVEADLILLILAKDLLKRIPKSKILFDIKSSQILFNEIRKAGGIPIIFKTGHSYFKTKMEKEKILLGGEVSGHIFLKENWYGFDDALFAGAKLLEVLSKQRKTLASIIDSFPKFYSTPEIKIPCSDEEKFEIVKKLKKYFKANYQTIDIDGVRILFDKFSWGLVRASNTSPNLTLRFEAKTKKKLEEIKKIVFDKLRKYVSLKEENQSS